MKRKCGFYLAHLYIHLHYTYDFWILQYLRKSRITLSFFYMLFIGDVLRFNFSIFFTIFKALLNLQSLKYNLNTSILFQVVKTIADLLSLSELKCSSSQVLLINHSGIVFHLIILEDSILWHSNFIFLSSKYWAKDIAYTLAIANVQKHLFLILPSK